MDLGCWRYVIGVGQGQGENVCGRMCAEGYVLRMCWRLMLAIIMLFLEKKREVPRWFVGLLHMFACTVWHVYTFDRTVGNGFACGFDVKGR
jgi:hypothetical protein